MPSHSTSKAAQLGLPLAPQQPYSLSYLVPHSGIAQAAAVLDAAVARAVEDRSSFQSFYLHGSSGAGKTHLAEGYAEAARGAGVPNERIVVLDFDRKPESEDWIPAYVSEYERLKREGGLLIAAGRAHPEHLTGNAHALSRFRAGEIVPLRYPAEEELRPLLASLSERRNLKLSERNLNYLIRRLPVNPLSFEAIFANIDQLCIAQGRPARLGVIQEVMKEDRLHSGVQKAGADGSDSKQ